MYAWVRDASEKTVKDSLKRENVQRAMVEVGDQGDAQPSNGLELQRSGGTDHETRKMLCDLTVPERGYNLGRDGEHNTAPLGSTCPVYIARRPAHTRKVLWFTWKHLGLMADAPRVMPADCRSRTCPIRQASGPSFGTLVADGVHDSRVRPRRLNIYRTTRSTPGVRVSFRSRVRDVAEIPLAVTASVCLDPPGKHIVLALGP